MITLEGARVIVIGSSGFLGGYLCGRLREAGCILFGLDQRPASNPDHFERFWLGHACDLINDACVEAAPDFVFHLAGPSSVPFSVEFPYEDFNGLLPATAKLLSSLAQAKIKARVIYFSSAAVYGNPKRTPVAENAEIKPISPYGAHKAVAETLIEHYSRIYNLGIVGIRIFSAYGPGLKRQLFWEVGQRALNAERSNQRHVDVLGTGSESRDFVHALDVADAACLVARHMSDVGFDVFNVASGSETSVDEAIALLLNELTPSVEPRFSMARRQGDPARWVADISKISSLGFRPGPGLSDKISELASWIRHETENITMKDREARIS